MGEWVEWVAWASGALLFCAGVVWWYRGVAAEVAREWGEDDS